jgi:hypothetical protein
MVSKSRNMAQIQRRIMMKIKYCHQCGFKAVRIKAYSGLYDTSTGKPEIDVLTFCSRKSCLSGPPGDLMVVGKTSKYDSEGLAMNKHIGEYIEVVSCKGLPAIHLPTGNWHVSTEFENGTWITRAVRKEPRDWEAA